MTGDRGDQTVTCVLCGKSKRRSDMFPAEMVRQALSDLVRRHHPEWGPGQYICMQDLNQLRAEYVEDVLEEDVGELSALEEEVVRSMREHDLLSRNVDAQFDRQLTLGERVADQVAEFGGSWTFILLFGVILVLWIAINSHLLLQPAFDPYPFILLNLILSCLAAIQAPIIMMSQNRQEDKDRLRGENDYRVNLKAELEVRHVNAKLDLLLTQQWRRLMEIQQIQLDLMGEFLRKQQDGPGH